MTPENFVLRNLYMSSELPDGSCTPKINGSEGGVFKKKK